MSKYENPDAQALYEKHKRNQKRIRLIAGATVALFVAIAAFQAFV